MKFTKVLYDELQNTLDDFKTKGYCIKFITEISEQGMISYTIFYFDMRDCSV